MPSIKFWKAASANAFSTTLNGSINNTDVTLALTSTSGLDTAGGVLVIDRQDGSGNNTPSKREYITFTGVSSNNITGVTRGVAGSTAQSHSSGALVEECFSVTHWNDLNAYLYVEHDNAGKHVISTATIATARVFTNLAASGASVVVSDFTINRYLSVSGVSMVGDFPINPTWMINGSLSGATTSIGAPLIMPRAGLFSYFSIAVNKPISAASLLLDINKNGTSIFEATTRPSLLAAGTYASTASILTRAFATGDTIRVDIDNGGGAAEDLIILAQGR